jgi:hypothetical protein
MRNTTNWHLYTSSDSGKKSTETMELEVEDEDIIKKIKLIEKAFR